MSSPSINRQISHFVWPAILSNAATPLLSLGDTIVIGQFASAKDLSAMGAGAAVLSMIIWLMGFLRVGTTGEVARHFDQNAPQNSANIAANTLLLALILGLLCFAVTSMGASLLASMINPGNDSNPLTVNYLNIRSFGLPASLMNMVIAGWLIGCQQPQRCLALVALCNISNLIMSIIAVAYYQQGASGVAYATVIAEYLTLSYGLYWLYRTRPNRPQFTALVSTRVMHQNQILFTRSAFLVASMTFFTAQSARLGDDVLALNTVLLNLLLLVSYSMDGVANGMEALCGQALGRQQLKRYKALFTAGVMWTLAFSMLFSLAFAVSDLSLFRLFSHNNTLATLFNDYKLWLFVFPLVSAWAYFLDGIFIAADNIKAMRNTVLVASLFYMGTWLVTPQWHSNHLLWGLFLAFHGVRVGGLLLHRGTWWPQPAT